MEEEIDLLQKDHNSQAKVRSLEEPTASEDESQSMGELAEMEGQQGDTSISELLPPFTDDMFEGGREREAISLENRREKTRNDMPRTKRRKKSL